MISLRQAFSNWLAYNAAAIKATTAATRRTNAERFFEWCAEHSIGFENIDRSHIAAFMRWCQDNCSLMNSTIAMRVKEIKPFFDWCVEECLLQANPIQMKHLPKLRVEIARKVPFTFEQWKAAETESQRTDDDDQGQAIYHDFWPSAMLIGYHTGARISDVALAQWINVSFETDVFIIWPKKKDAVKERLEVPMVPELREHLLTLWANRDDDGIFVLPAMAALYQVARTKLEAEFRVICDRAGLPDHSFHGFRHSLVSRLINEGVSAVIIGKITGQSQNTILSYAHVSIAAKRTALMGRQDRPKEIAL